MNKLIKIGLPSKGRLKDESLKFFKKNNLLIKEYKRINI
jgi:ATP phosphoribosyltransferase